MNSCSRQAGKQKIRIYLEMSLTVKGKSVLNMSNVYSAIGSYSVPGIDVVSRTKRKHMGKLTCDYKPGISCEAWSAPDDARWQLVGIIIFQIPDCNYAKAFFCRLLDILAGRVGSLDALVKQERAGIGGKKGKPRVVGEGWGEFPNFQALLSGAPGGHRRQVQPFTLRPAHLAAADFRNRDRSASGSWLASLPLMK